MDVFIYVKILTAQPERCAIKKTSIKSAGLALQVMVHVHQAKEMAEFIDIFWTQYVQYADK